MMTTVEHLMAWHTLFQTEGKYTGIVRRVFEESYQRLLWAICVDVSISTEAKVRALLIARLPVTAAHDLPSDEVRMKDLFNDLTKGVRIERSIDTFDCCVRVCQDLRLSVEEIDVLKSLLFRE